MKLKLLHTRKTIAISKYFITMFQFHKINFLTEKKMAQCGTKYKKNLYLMLSVFMTELTISKKKNFHLKQIDNFFFFNFCYILQSGNVVHQFQIGVINKGLIWPQNFPGARGSIFLRLQKTYHSRLTSS